MPQLVFLPRPVFSLTAKENTMKKKYAVDPVSKKDSGVIDVEGKVVDSTTTSKKTKGVDDVATLKKTNAKLRRENRELDSLAENLASERDYLNGEYELFDATHKEVLLTLLMSPWYGLSKKEAEKIIREIERMKSDNREYLYDVEDMVNDPEKLRENYKQFMKENGKWLDEHPSWKVKVEKAYRNG